MTNLTKALSRLDPTEGFVQYVNTVKPYHSKILDVLLEYVYTDTVKTSVKERWNWTYSFTRPQVDIVYSCGYGYRWDPTGVNAPDSAPRVNILAAVAQDSTLRANSFLIQAPAHTQQKVIITDQKSNEFAFVRSFNITAVSATAQSFTIQADLGTFDHFENNNYIYVTGNTGAGVNKRYNVLSSTFNGTSTTLVVEESVSLLATITGSVNFVLPFAEVPYWPSGTTVKMSSSGDTPQPISTAEEYHFIPSEKTGYFNLANTRYPDAWEQFIDLTSIGTGNLFISRTEPFVPGDPILVYGSTNSWNDGKYVIGRIVKEGSNFRIFVLQRVRKATPVGLSVDGSVSLDLQSYGMPSYCDLASAPDFHAETYIHETLQFAFEIDLRDAVMTYVVENQPTGIYGVSSTSSMLIPLGYDVQAFDVGEFD